MKSLGANQFFFLKILDKFRGKNLIFKKSGRPTIYLKILENFRGNCIDLEKFGGPTSK